MPTIAVTILVDASRFTGNEAYEVISKTGFAKRMKPMPTRSEATNADGRKVGDYWRFDLLSPDHLRRFRTRQLERSWGYILVIEV